MQLVRHSESLHEPFSTRVRRDFKYQVIKSRLQQRGTEEEIRAKASRYRGVVHCAAVIARKEGARGFFKGCVPYALRAAPASAITFVVYEEALKLLAYTPADIG